MGKAIKLCTCGTLKHTCVTLKITFDWNSMEIRSSPPGPQGKASSACSWTTELLHILEYSNLQCFALYDSFSSKYILALRVLVFIRPLNEILVKKYTDENILKRIAKLVTKFMIRIFYIIFATVSFDEKKMIVLHNVQSV